MRKTAYVLCAVLLAAMLAPAQVVSSGREPQMKSVSGLVTNAANQPLSNAIVYLKNTKTLAVKTFITSGDGNYRFHALSPNVDYELYAEANGARSDSKTISQFDSKPELTIHLKIKR